MSNSFTDMDMEKKKAEMYALARWAKPKITESELDAWWERNRWRFEGREDPNGQDSIRGKEQN